MGLISRKLCRLLLMFSTSFTSFIVFFFLYPSPSLSLCMIFDSASSNIGGVLSINPSANALSLETLTSIIRTDWPVLVELIDLVKSQRTLLRWLTFLLGFQTVILTVLLFCIYFFFLALVFVILIILLFEFPLIFYQIHSGMPFLLHSL